MVMILKNFDPGEKQSELTIKRVKVKQKSVLLTL